jgi:hypothetical protein
VARTPIQARKPRAVEQLPKLSGQLHQAIHVVLAIRIDLGDRLERAKWLAPGGCRRAILTFRITSCLVSNFFI